MKSYNDESYEGYFELGVQYPENLNNPHNISPFLLERIRI